MNKNELTYETLRAGVYQYSKVISKLCNKFLEQDHFQEPEEKKAKTLEYMRIAAQDLTKLLNQQKLKNNGMVSTTSTSNSTGNGGGA
nr:MAG: hypothetical protein [Microviridae sp.]